MKVSPVNVLVVFYCCTGETESLALAAAVGAVQARGNIRMRRLKDAGEDIPESVDNLERMRREYVPPTAADIAWADAVIVGMDGKIAGKPCTPAEATDWARQVTFQTRQFKETIN
jgi:hypothetical protein